MPPVLSSKLTPDTNLTDDAPLYLQIYFLLSLLSTSKVGVRLVLPVTFHAAPKPRAWYVCCGEISSEQVQVYRGVKPPVERGTAPHHLYKPKPCLPQQSQTNPLLDAWEESLPPSKTQALRPSAFLWGHWPPTWLGFFMQRDGHPDRPVYVSEF